MPTVVGLDLGSGSFRAVEITGKENKYFVSGFASTDSKEFSDSKAYSQSLKDLFKENKLSNKAVYLSLPEHAVFSTIIKVPTMKDKEIRGYLEYEAERIFPRPLNEISYSYEIVGTDPEDTNKVELLVVATANETVQKYLKLCKDAGLAIKGVEPETFSITRALNHYLKPSAGGAIMVVNIGLSDTDLIILRDGFVRFSKAYPIGGETFTKAISEAFKIDRNQAEEYKKTYGIETNVMEGKIFDVLRPFVETVVNEINRAKNFYIARNRGISINKVVFTGGSAVMPGLLYYMASSLDFEVELANPFVGVDFEPKFSEESKTSLINRGPMFTVSIGLALKDFIA